MTTKTAEGVLLLALSFQDLEDPRVEKNQLHPLLNLLVIAICGVITGAKGWEDLEDFGAAKRDWLAGFLDLKHGIPSADTFRRLFEALAPEQFEACFGRWTQALAKELAGEVIALDGKSIRSPYERAWGKSFLHLVHVWATKQRLVLRQCVVAGPSQEPVALPGLLSLVALKGAIVTADANGCTTKVLHAIRAGGGDYLLHIKGNRGRVYDHVVASFAAAPAPTAASYHRSEARGHGRSEVREVWVGAPDGWLQANAAWEDLRRVVRVKRQRAVGDRTSEEEHYYVTSLEKTAAELGGWLREHWRIENDLHWSLDVVFGEDDARVRDKTSAANLAVVRRIALTMLKREASRKTSVARKQKHAGWNNDYLVRVLAAAVPD